MLMCQEIIPRKKIWFLFLSYIADKRSEISCVDNSHASLVLADSIDIQRGLLVWPTLPWRNTIDIDPRLFTGRYLRTGRLRGPIRDPGDVWGVIVYRHTSHQFPSTHVPTPQDARQMLGKEVQALLVVPTGAILRCKLIHHVLHVCIRYLKVGLELCWLHTFRV